MIARLLTATSQFIFSEIVCIAASDTMKRELAAHLFV
jgi:hypothetical protein